MPQSLDDLPNELLEQIASDPGLWERRPPPSSNIFGVLSRVNRRLRGFALPHLFETLHLPLTDVSFAVPTISAGPFARLLALIRSDPIYENSIRELIVGHTFYPFFDLLHIGSVNASLAASRYAWEVFGAERPSPWNLESFACLDMSCGPSTIQALQSCAQLRILTLAWDDTTYPDLSGFSNLQSLRLVGKAIGRDIRHSPMHTVTGPASPCSSLRTLALHGGVAVPGYLVENLHLLYPNLRVLAVDKTQLAPADVLHMMCQHVGLEEVDAAFRQKPTVRLEHVIDVATGRTQSWPRTRDAQAGLAPRPRTGHMAWTRLMVESFAFVRQRKIDAAAPQPEHPSFDITSFALCLSGSDDYEPIDELTALFDRPAEFPFQSIRHFTFSIGPQENFSFPEQRYVGDLMLRMADLLSNWTTLETFTLHFDLHEREWQTTYAEGPVPVLDNTPVPTEYAGEELEPTLRNILIRYSSWEAGRVVREVSRILGHEVGMNDESIELDLIWLDRNEHIVTKGVRALAEKCQKLRAFRWFVDLSSDNPSTQWAYEIGRDKDGKVEDVQVQTSCLMSRKETLLEFKVLVGQELQTVAEAWPARHDEYIW